MVMTPINFVAFLVSLYIIDRQYINERIQRHGPLPPPSQPKPGHPSSSSSWLHRLLYTPRPYEWVGGSSGSSGSGDRESEGGRYYYHSKQRKLMKLEAADAFALRTPVLLGLGVLAAAALLLAGRLAVWSLGWLVVYGKAGWVN